MDPAVLLVGNFLSGSGRVRSVCEDLAARLVQQQWQVLTTSDRPGRVSRLVDMLGATWKLRSRYQVAHVDVFSGLSFCWAEAVCGLLRLLRKPYLLTLHGGNLPAFARRRPARVRRLLGSAMAVTVPSPYLLREMQGFDGNLCLIPNPLDAPVYPFEARERLRPRLIWLRAFHAIYNPALAPQVLAELVDDYPEATLLMIGPDKGDGSRQQAIDTARRLGVDDRLTMRSAVPKSDVPQWLCQGDIFLNTTNVDNTPVSVLEAAACGLCIVSTNVGGIPYLLEDESDALLVPPGEPGAMATAIRRLMSEPALAVRLSRNARKKAETFDWSHILPRWKTMFTSAMNGK